MRWCCHDVYRFYFEIAEHNGIARRIIENYLGKEKFRSIIRLEHGYEIELPIQCSPELTKELVAGGIGIYQIVRYAKTKKYWL